MTRSKSLFERDWGGAEDFKMQKEKWNKGSYGYPRGNAWKHADDRTWDL